MLTVVIESPYMADTAAGLARNLRYARACMAYCLANDAAPYASHALYTQPGVLNDQIPEDRKNGMRAGFAIGNKLQERWIFIDLGMTDGMLRGEEAAAKMTPPQKTRRLRIPDWEQHGYSNHDRLADQVCAGLMFHYISDQSLENVAPSREVVASWSDEDLVAVRRYLRNYVSDVLPCQGPAPEKVRLPRPACLDIWLSAQNEPRVSGGALPKACVPEVTEYVRNQVEKD